jgi:hypothetical protein
MFEENKIRAQMEIARMAIRAVTHGSKRMQLLCSPSGLGKTTLVLEELRRAGIRAAQYVSPTSASAFVRELYRHRHQPIIFFDDCDKLFRSETIANIAKMAFGPQNLVIFSSVEAIRNAERKTSGSPKYDPTIPPVKFYFRGKLIWCSNLNLTDEKIVATKMLLHFRALLSRGLDPMWIDTNDTVELFEYVVWLATEGGMLNKEGFSRAVSEEAINWFISHRNKVTELSPRQLVRAARIIKDFARDETTKQGLLGLMLGQDRKQIIPEMSLMENIGRNQWRSKTVLAA